jgi:hypothetical protein
LASRDRGGHGQQGAVGDGGDLDAESLAESFAGVVVLAVRAVPGRRQRPVDQYLAVGEHAGQLGVVHAGHLVEQRVIERQIPDTVG